MGTAGLWTNDQSGNFLPSSERIEEQVARVQGVIDTYPNVPGGLCWIDCGS